MTAAWISPAPQRGHPLAGEQGACGHLDTVKAVADVGDDLRGEKARIGASPMTTRPVVPLASERAVWAT